MAKKYETAKEYQERWASFIKDLYDTPRRGVDDKHNCFECSDKYSIVEMIGHVRENHPWIPEPTEPEECGNCRFSVPHGNSDLVVCRESSPQIDFGLGHKNGFFPSLHESLWCGKWEAGNND